MIYYARVVLNTNASVAVRQDDIEQARRWVEQERDAKPDLFRVGQIVQGGLRDFEVISTLDLGGWKSA